MERYRTTLILLALLVALGGLAMFLNNNRGGTPGGTPTATPTQYVWQDENQVIGIEVVSGTNKVTVRKDITTTFWAVTEPVQKDADTFSVSSVADSLKSLEATAQLTDTTNLSAYGLENPGMSVTSTFSDTQGTRRVLLVGDAIFDGSAYYVKTSVTGTVYIVSNQVIEPLRTWLTTPPVAPPTATPFPVTVVVTDTATITGTAGITTTLEPATSPAAGTAAPAGSPEATPDAVATPSELPEASPAAGTPGPSLNVTATISGVSPITNTNTQPGAANPTTPVASPVVPSQASPLATPAATP